MRVWTFDKDGCHEESSPDIAALIADPTRLFWVDLKREPEHAVRILTDQFHFHPLAVEDTLNERQRPKVEEYDGYLFTILNPVEYRAGELTFRELDAFIGANYLVTVHDDDEPMITAAINRIEKRGNSRLPLSAGYLLYVLVDLMVDSYFPIMDAIGDHIDELGEAILVTPRQLYLTTMFKLKRALSEMWRVIGHQRDMFAVLTREGDPFINHEALRYYLRDVYDHLLRVSDSVNTFRDTLSNLIDLYLSSTSNRLNIVVKRLTVFTILFGAFAVITGFYGMNFLKTFPPFEAEWGVPFVIVAMSLTGIGIMLTLGRDN